MESGHTPSRRHPEYWGGYVSWLGIRDAKANHGSVIFETEQKTNNLGIENSSARILPKGTVCLSRTASVGYVVRLGQPMATSQDFANWICSDKLDPCFLTHLLMAEGSALNRFGSGAVHQTIYYPELKALHICMPPLAEQKRIVAILDAAFEGIDTAIANAEQNLANARALFSAHLTSVFRWGRPGWAETHFGALALVKSGSGFPKRYQGQTGEQFPLYKVSDMKLAGNEREMTNENNSVSEAVRAQLGASVLQPGSVIFPKIGGAISTNKKRIVIRPSCVDNNVMGIEPTVGRLDSLFLYYLMRSIDLTELSSDAHLPSIRQSAVNEWRVVLPSSVEDQHDVAEDIADVEAQTERLIGLQRAKLRCLAELKSTLLHAAFCGDLDTRENALSHEAAE